ncbi:MAG: NAD(P)/FAD-dependent oxidoreductase [Planctomycetota bacterium]
MAADVVHVIGGGANGLAAAIVLAGSGLRVVVHEAQSTVGGSARSAALTLPGYVHDRCSGIHPLAVSSPFFRTLPLAGHGLEWVQPPAPCAHPLDDGTAVLCERSVDATAEGLGVDAKPYRDLLAPLVRCWDELAQELLRPPLRLPRHPLLLARLGWAARRSARALVASVFRGERARALFGGMAAHAVLPLDALPTSAFGLVLTTAAHAVGWPLPRGGAQRIADALAAHLRLLGGEIRLGDEVTALRRFGDHTVVFDLTPRQIELIAGAELPDSYRTRLRRFRYGPGAFKLDWALEAPIPWRARECARAGTVHVGGTFEEIAVSERDVFQGRHSDRPFVLLAQHTLFDPTRAPGGKHTAWAYCHVPNGSTTDMTERIEAQVERFAPGFRNRILARHAMSAASIEHENANLVGGDFTGGSQNLAQLLARPRMWGSPYRTPNPRIFLCSASTPPGAGVHGMCGWHAAQAVLASRR